MDVDSDFDQTLLQQFSCLGTTDRDVLITQLQKLVGNQLNAAGCAFFLDMNNWNLQAAVCSFFDLEAPKDRMPRMAFVKDVTIGEGESIPPNTKFIKTWRLQNSGEEYWPVGSSLKFVEGDCLSIQDRVLVGALRPHEMADVSVEMQSPEKPGIYQGQWRMCTATGSFFGAIHCTTTVFASSPSSLQPSPFISSTLANPSSPIMATLCQMNECQANANNTSEDMVP